MGKAYLYWCSIFASVGSLIYGYDSGKLETMLFSCQNFSLKNKKHRHYRYNSWPKDVSDIL